MTATHSEPVPATASALPSENTNSIGMRLNLIPAFMSIVFRDLSDLPEFDELLADEGVELA